jgi:hypothetical protein
MNCCSAVRGAACHCPRCHLTFSGLGSFDQHQDVNYDRKPPVLCVDPKSLGLVRDSYGTYRTPEGVLSLAEKAARMRLAKAGKR